MTKTTTSVPTTLWLPVDLVERYDVLAKATGHTRTFFLTQALQDSIARLEYEYGILKKVEDYRSGRLETVTLNEIENEVEHRGEVYR